MASQQNKKAAKSVLFGQKKRGVAGFGPITWRLTSVLFACFSVNSIGIGFFNRLVLFALIHLASGSMLSFKDTTKISFCGGLFSRP